MAGYAPMVLGGIKRMVLDDILPRGPSEQWALQGQRLAAIRNSEDFQEGGGVPGEAAAGIQGALGRHAIHRVEGPGNTPRGLIRS